MRRGIRVTRNGEGDLLWSGESGGRGVLMSSVETPDVLGLWDWSLETGDAIAFPGDVAHSYTDPHPHRPASP